MTCVLDFWNRRWQSVSFCTARGCGRVRWFAKKSATLDGWAYRHKGAWYALWSDGTDIVFQAGREQWRMNDQFSCSIRYQDGKRCFTISTASEKVFETSYKPGRHEADPTYDAVDLEQEDFFIYVERCWSDARWKAQARQNWAPAGNA